MVDYLQEFSGVEEVVCFKRRQLYSSSTIHLHKQDSKYHRYDMGQQLEKMFLFDQTHDVAIGQIPTGAILESTALPICFMYFSASSPK